jgi:hypothetical protein
VLVLLVVVVVMRKEFKGDSWNPKRLRTLEASEFLWEGRRE